MQVDALIAEQDLDLTEEEYAQLIGVCAHEGATWRHAAVVLARMSRELTQLQPATLAAVERFFRCAVQDTILAVASTDARLLRDCQLDHGVKSGLRWRRRAFRKMVRAPAGTWRPAASALTAAPAAAAASCR